MTGNKRAKMGENGQYIYCAGVTRTITKAGHRWKEGNHQDIQRWDLKKKKKQYKFAFTYNFDYKIYITLLVLYPTIRPYVPFVLVILLYVDGEVKWQVPLWEAALSFSASSLVFLS